MTIDSKISRLTLLCLDIIYSGGLIMRADSRAPWNYKLRKRLDNLKSKATVTKPGSANSTTY